MTYSLKALPVNYDITPYYMARLVCDIFRVAKCPEDKPGRDWHKYFLYCVTIEIDLKAALLNNNNTAARKRKNKRIGHDLSLLLDEASELVPADLFDAKDKKAIDQISVYFHTKSLEYVSGELLEQIVSKGKDLPSIADLEVPAHKVVEFIEGHRYFTS